MITEFVITGGEIPKRLDRFLVHREPSISRSRLQRLVEQGRIRVNGKIAKPGQKIKPGDHITMDTPQPGSLTVNGENIPLDILYEDDVLLVVNKPSGIVVHPTSGNWAGTLMNALLSHLENNGEWERSKSKRTLPGIVHRLDKETSGVMVIAKTDEAHRQLSAQFEKHSITRMYEALVLGNPSKGDGVIERAIGRDTNEHKKVSLNTSQPRMAITKYRVIQQFGDLGAQVMLLPETGRTHQLRVHMASLNCPILGDQLYGSQLVCSVTEHEISRVMLHARTLGFQHPSLGTFQEYSTDLPDDMQRVVQALDQWKTRLSVRGMIL